MRLDDGGRPVHRDATVKIRPRLFLEGNWFLDLKPGTADEPEIEDGGEIPLQQTAGPVQLSQLLSTLDVDIRENLQTLLREYSSSLEGEGADGYRRSIRWWKPAYRDSSLVQTATLGRRAHDLSGYIDGAGRFARGLDADPEALKALITDFNAAAGAFAREAGNLEAAIAELPRTIAAARPALAALNEAFPPLRRFAADLRPSVRETGRTVGVAQPFLHQLRLLVSQKELRGLVADLEPTVPSLAQLVDLSRPLYEELRSAAGCENDVLDPWSNDTVPDPNFPAKGKVYEEAPKPLPGLAGESRSGDANGQWVRVLTSAGERTVHIGGGQYAQAYVPILGTNPPKPVGRPPLRPDVACETQERPDLRTNVGPGDTEVARGLPKTAAAQARYVKARERAVKWFRGQVKREGLKLRVDSKEVTR
jgi:ABC-type transporter Mla subunit MlaD